MTRDEYNESFNRNHRVTGAGFDTTVHMPCPFCTAPDFLVFRVIETETALSKGGTCEQCGRGMRGELRHGEGGVSLELMQTSGPDPDVEGIVMPRRVRSTDAT